MITNEIQQTQVKTIHFFNKIKIIKNHTNTNKKTPYYTPYYHSSDDDNFHDQNHQQNSQNQRLQSYHVNQPDIFEQYTREQHMRQPRPNYEHRNNNFYSQNPANTDYYQPTQI